MRGGMHNGLGLLTILTVCLSATSTLAVEPDAQGTANEPCPLVLRHPFEYRVYFPSGESQWREDFDHTLEVAADVAVTESTNQPDRCDPRFVGLKISGHSDTVGTEQDAMRLSRLRTTGVVDRLLALGVPLDLITMDIMGDLAPPVATADETVEPLNNVVIIDFEYE